jgi:hypothetical protein
MKLLIITILCLCNISVAHAEIPRRAFLATGLCALFFRPNIKPVLGLEVYAKNKTDHLVRSGIVPAEKSQSLYEDMRWEIWDQIQAAALANPNKTILDVNATYILASGDGKNFIDTPSFKVTAGGEFSDPVRGKERLITRIEQH